MDLVGGLASGAGRLLLRLGAWWWRRSYAAWRRAWGEPARGLRLFYLGFGLLISWALIPPAFTALGFMGAASYLFALFLALSNATFFRVVKVGHAKYVPLGVVAPLAILVGVAGSRAMGPLLGDARDAAFAGDLVGAVVILGAFVAISRLFGEWRSGNPYGSPPPRRRRRKGGPPGHVTKP